MFPSTRIYQGKTQYDFTLLLSGGLDSATLLYYFLIEQKATPLALHFRGLTSKYEAAAASKLATEAGVELAMIDVTSFISACTDISLSGSKHNHRLAYGNTVVLSMALAFSIEHKIPSVAVALHKEDADAYIENTPAFLRFISSGLELIDKECDLRVPFQSLRKADVLRQGAQLGVPFEMTWSCLTPIEGIQDGVCSACEARKAAFAEAGVSDPTIYARSIG